MAAAVFHADELAAHARAGVATTRSGIRDFMPEQHRTFFAGLPYILVAVSDARAARGVVLGAGNAAGGYVVTERMLEMFKSSKQAEAKR